MSQTAIAVIAMLATLGVVGLVGAAVTSIILSIRLVSERTARKRNRKRGRKKASRMQRKLDRERRKREGIKTALEFQTGLRQRLEKELLHERQSGTRRRLDAVKHALDRAAAAHQNELAAAHTRFGADVKRALVKLIAEREEAVKLLLIKNRGAEALPLQQEVLGLAIATGSHARHASALHNLALMTAKFDNLGRAQVLAARAVEIAEAHTPDDPRLAAYKRHLDKLNKKLLQGQYQGLFATAQQLCTFGQSVNGGRTFIAASKVAAKLGNHKGQVICLINATDACLDADCVADGFAIVKDALALITPEMGADGEQLREALEKRQASLEEQKLAKKFHEHLARASQLLDAQNLKEAEDAARDAWYEAKRTFGETHHFAGQAMDTIGVALFMQGEAAQALDCFENAFQVVREWDRKPLQAKVQHHLSHCRQYLTQQGDS